MILAKIVDNGILLSIGISVLRYDDRVVTNPRPEDFSAAGFKPLEMNELPDKEGFIKVPTYIDAGDKIIGSYRYKEKTEDEEVGLG